MSFLPIVLDVKGKLCVVIGGGRVARRKVGDILAAGGLVRLVSPALDPELEQLAKTQNMEVLRQAFDPSVLEGAFLVFVATDDETVNESAAAAARKRGLLVNVADRPPLCDFHVPAVIRRGDLLVTFSTGGKSPALARRLKKKLGEDIGEEYASLLELLGRLRQETASRPDLTQTERQALYERVLDSEILELLRQGKTQEAQELIDRLSDKIDG